MRGEVATPLTPDAARALTDEVRADARALWAKMLLLYLGDAHRVLGYRSWAAFAEAEFEVSDSTAYRWLQSARVVEQLPIGSWPSSESVARELVPTLKDGTAAAKWADVIKQHGPAPTAAQTREVVRGEVVTASLVGASSGSPQPAPPKEAAGDALLGAPGQGPGGCEGEGRSEPIPALIDSLATLDARLDESAILAAWSEADDGQRADLDDALTAAISTLRDLQRRARQTTWADPEPLIETEPLARSGSMYDPAGDFA